MQHKSCKKVPKSPWDETGQSMYQEYMDKNSMICKKLNSTKSQKSEELQVKEETSRRFIYEFISQVHSMYNILFEIYGKS